ncbi:hypothetical protein GN956_G16691 [Arapaima gigas]
MVDIWMQVYNHTRARAPRTGSTEHRGLGSSVLPPAFFSKVVCVQCSAETAQDALTRTSNRPPVNDARAERRVAPWLSKGLRTNAEQGQFVERNARKRSRTLTPNRFWFEETSGFTLLL